jgi:hypothetical protein
VRKDFTAGLTREERAHYIKTVKKAASIEPYKSRSEELTTAHAEFYYLGIHFLPNTIQYFLPWRVGSHYNMKISYEN